MSIISKEIQFMLLIKKKETERNKLNWIKMKSNVTKRKIAVAAAHKTVESFTVQ